MRCVFLSDLHLKTAGDEACILFNKFCSHEVVKNATHIFLLGDIFDLLIGEHPEYFQKYDSFFKSMIELINNKQNVTYLEGNHDFHIQSAMKAYVDENSKNLSGFEYLTQGKVILLGESKYYICHGDEVDSENEAFKRWKKIYSSNKFAILINKILTFKFIEFLGSRVSQNSRKRGKKSFDFNKMKNKYINGAHKLILERGVDGIIGGHTHIQEDHTFEDGTRYFNCGHPLSHKNFLSFDGHHFSFISLEDS